MAPKKGSNGSVERLKSNFRVALPNEGEVRRALFERLEAIRDSKPSGDSNSASEKPGLVYDVVPSSIQARCICSFRWLPWAYSAWGSTCS